MQFMQHMAIDIDQVAPVGALPDPMEIPDLVEQCTRHAIILGRGIGRRPGCPILSGATAQGKPAAARMSAVIRDR
jgi:hypothetical protein